MSNQTRFSQNSIITTSPPSAPLSPVPNQPTQPLEQGQVRRQLLRLNTLMGQFTALVFGSALLTIIAWITAFLVLTNVSTNFNEIINNSSPSVLAAQRFGQAVQDADAKAADYQLYYRITQLGATSGLPNFEVKAAQAQAWDTILKRRKEAGDALFIARANITYPGEADAISAISDRFLDYTGRIDTMRYLLDQNRWEEALVAYKNARDILVGNLGNANLDPAGRSPEEQAKLAGYPKFDVTRSYLGIEANVRKLYEINKGYLTRATDEALGTISTLNLITIISSTVMVIALILLYFRAVFVMHRVINPGYFLALGLAIGVTIGLTLSLNQAKQDYQTVAKDSFISIESIANIRQLSADANADESRLLLNPDALGLNSTSSVLTAEVKKIYQADVLEENFNKKQALIKEQLKKAWGNITYKGEFEALCKITQNPGSGNRCAATAFALDDYLKLDRTIRDDFKQNKLGEAIKINTGVSNDTFAKWDGALLELSKINEIEFNRGACTAFGTLKFGTKCSELGYNSSYVPLWQIGIWVIFPLIALATVGGFWRTRPEF